MANLWNGLRAYYQFDDAASNPTDLSRYSVGAFSNAGYDALGKLGSGMRTTTAAGKMTAPSSPYLHQCGNPPRVSVQAWVSLDKAFSAMWSANGVYLAKRAVLGTTGSGYFLGVIGDTSANIIYRIHNLAGTPYSASYAEGSTSGWIHYVGTYGQVYATVTLDPAGANNSVLYAAVTPGTGGNSITIRYVVAGNNTPLSVSVATNAITVNVATNAGGSPTSTANQVRAAIAAFSAAAALVTSANDIGNDGTGVVAAIAATSLTGGSASYYARLYRNGVSVATAVADGTVLHALAEPLELGEGLEGVLDEVAVWGRQLSPTDVLDLYNNGAGVRMGYGAEPTDVLFRGPAIAGLPPVRDPLREDPDQPIVIPLSVAGLSLGNPTPFVVQGSRLPCPAWSATLQDLFPAVLIGGVVVRQSVAPERIRGQLENYAPSFQFGYVVHVPVQGARLQTHSPTIIGSHRGIGNGIVEAALATPFDPLPLDCFLQVTTVMPAARVFRNGAAIETPLAFRDMPDESDWIDPEPTITAVTASSDHLMSMEGYAGPTNIPDMRVYWEVELIAGEAYLRIDMHEDVDLGSPTTFSDTFAIPQGLSLDGTRIRLCADAPPLEREYQSAWTDLDGAEYDNSTPVIPPLPPGPPIGPPQEAIPRETGPGYVSKVEDRSYVRVF